MSAAGAWWHAMPVAGRVLLVLIAALGIAAVARALEEQAGSHVARWRARRRAARRPAPTRPLDLGDLVIHPEAETWTRRVCLRCRLGDLRQPCTCLDGCGEDDCLAWANSISNTEEWER